MTDFKTIKLETKNSVAWLYLHRPESRNAMSPEMGDEFAAAISELKTNKDVRALVVAGEGKSFSSGGDLRGDASTFQLPLHERRDTLRAFYPKFLCVTELEIPTIAMINGHGVGAGMLLALACDLRVMSKSAKLGAGFLRIGLSPGMGGTYFLPRLLGTAKALELLWTSEMIDAEECYRIGLVNKIAEADQVEQVTADLANKVASAPPIAVKMVKRAVYGKAQSEMQSALEYEALCQVIVTNTEDFREGAMSFLQKRDPHFKGK